MKARTEALNANAPRELRPGDVLAGKFRVDRVLGQGGMGVVVAAHHLQLDQKVAIKLLLPQSLRNPEVVARFAQEARSTAQIHSEHVVRVLDVGNDEGAPYIVMEYLEGRDLLAELKTRGPMPMGPAVEYVLQACEALAEAHRLGIVHRDLKPANLFLSRRADGSPLIKVLDFGISKAALSSAGGVNGGLTADSSVMGSPNYMSPEQLRNSKDVDARADLWSLGLVLYELLTGTVAFHADTLAELHLGILQGTPRPLSGLRPDLPPGLEAIIQRCLSKDRAYRFSTVAEMAQALAPFAPASAQVSVDRVCRVMGVPYTPLTPGSTGAPASGWSSTGAPASQPAWSSSFSPPSSQGVGVLTPAPLPPPAWQPHTPMPLAPPAWQPPGATTPWNQGATPPPGSWNAPALAEAPGRRSPSLAFILMILLVALVVISGAGCLVCVGLAGR